MDPGPKTLVSATHKVPQPDEAGLLLHVRERRPQGLPPGGAGRAVLFVHGATFSSGLWDLRPPGLSFLDAVAAAGMPAYALDIRGYGRSRSTVMESEGGPYARAGDAIRDIDRVAEFLQAREGLARVCLLGGSWGSITAGLYAATLGRDKLERLVLYAPIFSDHNADWLALIADPSDPSRPNPALGPYRRVGEAETRMRWDAEIPLRDKTLWRDEAVFRALLEDAFDADPMARNSEPPAFRAPNGTLLDLFEAFNRRPLYDPGAIRVPVLLIRGTFDPTSTRADATGLFDRLASPVKRYVEIGEGAHFVSAERNAWQVIDEVVGFLGRPLAGRDGDGVR